MQTFLYYLEIFLQVKLSSALQSIKSLKCPFQLVIPLCMTLFLKRNSGNKSNKRLNLRCQQLHVKMSVVPNWDPMDWQFQSKLMLFCGYQQRDSKVNMKRQNTQNSQHNIKEQSWRNDTA